MIKRTIGGVSVILLGFWVASCQGDVKLEPGECGNGVLNRGEECDKGEDNDDFKPDACRTNCMKAHCGDLVKDTNETCEGVDLGSTTCVDLGYEKGTLLCSDECEFDESGCSTCGDGFISGEEECDDQDVGGRTCQDLGFQSGELACGSDCRLDKTGCVNGCGNDKREGTEECDGADLGGSRCQDVGFESGSLGCMADCTFDLGGCVGGCGNGVVEQGEVCDDGNRVWYDGCTNCMAGDGTFGPGEILPSCARPVTLAAKDLDGDGKKDLVVGCIGGPEEEQAGMAVHFGAGDGTFFETDLIPMSERITELVLRDLDQDGWTEILASYQAPSGSTGAGGLMVLKGQSGATFGLPQLYPFGTRPVSLVVADLNGDGYLDAAVSDLTENRIWFMSGDNQGVMTYVDPMSSYGGPARVRAADLDLDRMTDLVTLRQQQDMVISYISVGALLFSAPAARMVGDRPADLVVGPFNGDAYPDLAVVNAGEDTVSILVGFGDGQFSIPVDVEVPGGPQAAVSGWVNNDSNIDLVVGCAASDQIWVLLGDGGGTFTRGEEPTPTCDSPVALALADFDGDGIMDVAAACSFTQQVWVHLGNAAQVR